MQAGNVVIVTRRCYNAPIWAFSLLGLCRLCHAYERMSCSSKEENEYICLNNVCGFLIKLTLRLGYFLSETSFPVFK